MRRSLCHSLCLAAIAVPLLTLSAYAQPNSQQDVMKACNAQAKEQALKGDTRKTFMSNCLSGRASTPSAMQPASEGSNSQQSLMKQCNAQASSQSLRGAPRKQFMSSCLSGGHSSLAPATTAPMPTRPSPSSYYPSTYQNGGGTAVPRTTPQYNPTYNNPQYNQPYGGRYNAPQTPSYNTPSYNAPSYGAPNTQLQNATASEAQARCGRENVVWVNTNSHVYHYSGHTDFGNTKQGAYMCESNAQAEGDRPAANEKGPK